MSASLTIAREFAASPKDVFAAWTNPDAIMKWWGMPGMTNLSCAFEAKEGGEWHVQSRHPDGKVVTARGKIIRVIQNEMLVYDWRFDGQPDEAPSSLVTVHLSKIPTGTRLLLEHANLGDDNAIPLFRSGWVYTLDNFVANVFTVETV